MKNKILSIIVLITFSGFIWTACDKIDNPLIVVNEQDIPLDLDTNFIADSVIVSQKQVLLEDFTGHKCINCPTAAITAHGWIEEFNDRLIIYSIHAGNWAEPADAPYTADFRCETGDELYNYYDTPNNPSALINRVEYNGNIILYYISGDWEPAVGIEMAKENVIDLKVINEYYTENNAIYIKTYATFKQQLEGKFKIVIYIVEDNIISPQRNNNHDLPGAPDDNDWLDYNHRNVLRDAVNGTHGTYLSIDGTITEGEEYAAVNFYEINEEWVTANCNIIVYIYDEESQEILQVAELGIKTE